MKIITWNVNGIRAAVKKGFLEWFAQETPDILCVQETKAYPEQLPEALISPPGYTSYWASAERKGYSGVVTYVKDKPQFVKIGFDIEEYDIEGRVISVTYPEFTLFNVYFPNGGRDLKRVDYKLAFYRDFLAYCNQRKEAGENIIICGDFNTAHQEIDLANPKANIKNTGFLPEERAWIDRYIEQGYLDVFRKFNQSPGQYTWWSYRSGARAKNIGWRLDFFLLSENLQATDNWILSDIMGSDHCPVALILSF